MLKMQKAYLLKDRGLVVLNKSDVKNAQDSELEEVSICIPVSLIKEWSEEIVLTGLDEDEALE